MGAFSDLDKNIDKAKERTNDAKENVDEWRREDK